MREGGAYLRDTMVLYIMMYRPGSLWTLGSLLGHLHECLETRLAKCVVFKSSSGSRQSYGRVAFFPGSYVGEKGRKPGTHCLHHALSSLGNLHTTH